MNKRIEKLLAFLPKEVDAALITSGSNRFYFTGLRSSAGVLLVTREGAYFIIDFRYIEKAKNTVTGAQVLLQENLYEQLNELLAKHGVKQLALEGEGLSLADYHQYKQVLKVEKLLGDATLDKAIFEGRAMKDDAEVATMKTAQKLTDETFTYILERIAAGRTERDVMLEMEFHIRKLGAEKASFDFIVVSGKNSSMPHGKPSDKKIETGDFVTMDFGCVYDGYCSDMTRTVAIGSVSEAQEKVYNTVLEAQLAVLSQIKAGLKGKEVDAIARNIINKAGYEGCFGHGLGHCLGIDVHENPRCAQDWEEVLRPGMVTSVEPGIYLAGEFGVRIEDVVMVTETGCDNFTKSKKELIIL